MKIIKELGFKKVINFGAGLGYKKHQELLGEELELINYDPNIEEIDIMPIQSAEAVVCNNVLNVIESDTVVNNILCNMERYNIPIYITIYEGDKSGIGKYTSRGTYQRNLKTRDYPLQCRGYKLKNNIWIKE